MVSQLRSEREVLSEEAYLLFYQKRVKPDQSVVHNPELAVEDERTLVKKKVSQNNIVADLSGLKGLKQMEIENELNSGGLSSGGSHTASTQTQKSEERK